MSEIAQLRTGFVASVPIYYPPSALNVKVKKFIEARVNGGSNLIPLYYLAEPSRGKKTLLSLTLV